MTGRNVRELGEIVVKNLKRKREKLMKLTYSVGKIKIKRKRKKDKIR